jgi:hypothetical protein
MRSLIKLRRILKTREGNPILMERDPSDGTKVSWDKSPQLLKNRCPIQLVEDSDGDMWITLLSYIDFDNAEFKNIIRFRLSGVKFNFVDDLINAEKSCRFMEGDLIINPSIEEYKYIQETFKEQGYIFNKKTNEFQKID